MSLSVTRNPNLAYTPHEPQPAHLPSNLFSNLEGQNWWTGLSPEQCSGFLLRTRTLHASPLLNLEKATRQDILNYFNNSWTLTEVLFSGLRCEEAFIRPPYHELRHPLIFYYGHPAVLYVNKLRIAGYIPEALDLYLEKVLEIGVDEMSWDDMSKNEMNWPSVAEVRAYRQKVYSVVKNLIETHPDFEFGQKRGPEHPTWALFMAFEHEKIHFETSSVLIRELPIELVEKPEYWPSLHPTSEYPSSAGQSKSKPVAGQDYPVNHWKTFSGQKIQYGKDQSWPSFGWDNEYGKREVEIKDFQLSEYLVSNGEYYQFVASGAYSQDKYWSEEGRMWRKFRNTRRPTFWSAYGPEGLHEYKLRTIWQVIDMPWAWPAEVNFHEAQAYCAWKREQDKTKLYYRLPTEAEHQAVRETVVDAPDNMQREAIDPVLRNEHSFNFNFRWASPWAVNSGPASKLGLYDTFGNVWQWMEDQFNPLEGFKTHSYYDDFSTPCFDGKHQMILGGSFISCGHEASVWARFHFRPHFFQHSGFRLSASLDGSHDNASKKLLQTTEYVHAKRFDSLEQMEGSKWWQKVQQPLEMNPQEMQEAFALTEKYILDFYQNLEKLHPGGEAHDPRKNSVPEDFRLAYQSTRNLPTRPEKLDQLYKTVFQELAPLGQFPGHPAYAAYVAGAGNLISALAQSAAMTLNPFTGHFMMAPGLVALEAEAMRWFIHLFQFPEKTAQGLFTTGGSLATVSALQSARHAKFQNADWLKACVYVSDQAHHCVAKALHLMGFPKESLRIVQSEPKTFSMSVSALKDQIQKDKSQGLIPFVITGTAGTTNTGAIDSLQELAALAKTENMWFHVDGAYGALFKLTEQGSEKLKGIEEADSLVFDPHKALSLPYGTGALIVRDGQFLKSQESLTGSYMPPAIEADNLGLQVDYADMSYELSRDFRGLRVWLPLKTFGIGPFQLNLEEKLQLTNWFVNELRGLSGVQVVAEPQLSIFAIRLSDEQKTQELLVRLNKGGTLFISSCKPDGILALRFCLLGFRLHYDRLQKALTEIKTIVQDLER